VLDRWFTKGAYRDRFDAVPEREYTLNAAAKTLLSENHYGPWHHTP